MLYYVYEIVYNVEKYIGVGRTMIYARDGVEFMQIGSAFGA